MLQLSARRLVRSMSAVPRVPNLINGQQVQSATSHWIEVHDPATNKVVCHVPESTPAELRAASDGAAEAFRAWREVPVQQRARVYLKLQQLIRDNTEALAASWVNSRSTGLVAFGIIWMAAFCIGGW